MQLKPTDRLRFGYRIWSEKRTGLVIKTQTLDPSGRVLEQTAFSELQLDAPVPAEAMWLKGDPFRLRQIVNNLMSNALKFSPEGGTVVLSVEREGPWLRWRVRDEGPGIAPTEQARIFERFYRSPSARGVPGTGLGLAIVKHLAGLMNGEVAVSSELGRGSTFTLSLPLVEWKVESTWNAPA